MTGVVGAAGAISTWQASSSATTKSLHGERTRADLADLRSLFDDADRVHQRAVRVSRQYLFASLDWQDRVREDGDGDAVDRARRHARSLYDRYKVQYEDGLNTVFRLKIRLGEDSRIPSEFQAMIDCLDSAVNSVEGLEHLDAAALRALGDKPVNARWEAGLKRVEPCHEREFEADATRFARAVVK